MVAGGGQGVGRNTGDAKSGGQVLGSDPISRCGPLSKISAVVAFVKFLQEVMTCDERVLSLFHMLSPCIRSG